MGLFVWKWRVEKMWDWGQGIVLVSGGPSWEGFYVQLYKVVTSPFSRPRKKYMTDGIN